MPQVLFVETRQIRRNHKTVQWRAGETYEYDHEMEPMIKIGHARVVEDAPAFGELPETVINLAVMESAKAGLENQDKSLASKAHTAKK
jgi:hypothetical protein